MLYILSDCEENYKRAMKKQSEEKSCTLLLDVQLNLYNLCYSLSGTDCGRVNEDTGCDI